MGFFWGWGWGWRGGFRLGFFGIGFWGGGFRMDVVFFVWVWCFCDGVVDVVGCGEFEGGDWFGEEGRVGFSGGGEDDLGVGR